MDLIELKANERQTKGDGPAKTLRRDGLFPAVVYGPKTDPKMLSISTADFENVLKQGTSGSLLLGLVIGESGDKPMPVMIKELQRHPVSRNFLHVDLYEVDLDKKINVSVPVVTTGKSKGVELGGMLQIIRREVEVYCRPNEIPESITIDITDLDAGESVHVQDIPLEGNLEFPADVNYTVLTILSQKVEEVEIEEEEEGIEEAGEAAETEGEE